MKKLIITLFLFLVSIPLFASDFWVQKNGDVYYLHGKTDQPVTEVVILDDEGNIAVYDKIKKDVDTWIRPYNFKGAEEGNWRIMVVGTDWYFDLTTVRKSMIIENTLNDSVLDLTIRRTGGWCKVNFIDKEGQIVQSDLVEMENFQRVYRMENSEIIKAQITSHNGEETITF